MPDREPGAPSPAHETELREEELLALVARYKGGQAQLVYDIHVEGARDDGWTKTGRVLEVVTDRRPGDSVPPIYGIRVADCTLTQRGVETATQLGESVWALPRTASMVEQPGVQAEVKWGEEYEEPVMEFPAGYQRFQLTLEAPIQS